MTVIAPHRGRRRLIGMTEETEVGTHVAPTVPLAGSIIEEITHELQDPFADGQRRGESKHEGEFDAERGPMLVQFGFRMRLRYGDAFLSLLTGAGFKATDGVYKPTSDFADRKTWSAKIWESGVAWPIRGAVVRSCKLSGKAGGDVTAEFGFLGVAVMEADDDWQIAEAMPTETIINGASTYKLRGATLTIGGSAIPPVSSVELDLGIETAAAREDVTAAEGVLAAIMEGIYPTLALDPEARTIANGSPWGAFTKRTTAALALSVEDLAGNALTIGAPRLQYRGITRQTRNGIRVDQINYSCNVSAGDDAISLQAVAAG